MATPRKCFDLSKFQYFDNNHLLQPKTMYTSIILHQPFPFDSNE